VPLLVQPRHLLDDFEHPLAVDLARAAGERAGSEFDDDSMWSHGNFNR
jgi:hypothetical protein